MKKEDPLGSRPEIVYRLICLMNEAVLNADHLEEATMGEVVSAYLTLTNYALQVVREMGGDMGQIRQAVEQILLTCTEDPPPLPPAPRLH